MNFIVNSDISLQSFIGSIREEYKLHRYLQISVRTGKDRSLDQNAISHAWYDQLSRELREDDARGWKRYCKLTIGIPILRADDAKFREDYNLTLRDLTYEQKLKIMDWFPVTSLMTKGQLSKYLEAMQLEFSNRVRLEFPPDEPLEAA